MDRQGDPDVIPVARPDEPEDFDRKCRQPGKQWLESLDEVYRELPPGERPDPPKDVRKKTKLWSQYCSKLRSHYGNRCGFLAMFTRPGTIDHWISIANDRRQAFEWTNFRFVDSGCNSAKKPAWEGRLLDPHEVEDGWFEVLLPSLQLEMTRELTDPVLREKAQFTLEKLRLRDGEDIIAYRREWLVQYEKGLPLDRLAEFAPLLARAIAKRDGLPDPTRCVTSTAPSATSTTP